MQSNFLSRDLVEQYKRDGYVFIKDLFSPQEVKAMIAEVEGGSRVAANTNEPSDASGRKSKLAIWFDIGDDIWGAASTCPRIVNNVRILLGEEAAFFHGKVMLKEARSGGAWEWHQDYGYWYQQGYLYPRMLSAFVALDAATKENGCLQVLRGSHKLGRLNHERVGTQAGAEPERLRKLEPYFERVACEMSPGTVLFFHGNLLHSSTANESDKHRRSFIMCYNALSNPQLTEKKTSEQRPCPVGPDDAILRFSR
ncbi:MAG TPA: phytanoyl-CoA dioxygenase family protein [Tepidisphaeraceae bacterium]|jgi:ectoine hydroxylase-related dioxygenase (phytanoyl-CoA dioxygenase family)|nr:phytanoyl-CoA dioxygenase family protein [Tepidisphaeraceae bacterium]